MIRWYIKCNLHMTTRAAVTYVYVGGFMWRVAEEPHKLLSCSRRTVLDLGTGLLEEAKPSAEAAGLPGFPHCAARYSAALSQQTLNTTRVRSLAPPVVLSIHASEPGSPL